MNTISYYPSTKSYETPKPVCPQPDDDLSLTQIQSGFGISMKFSGAGRVRDPRFYVCRGAGFLRLDRRSFFAVQIPEQFLPALRHCPGIDVSLSDDEEVSRRFCATVEHVLRFPEYVKRGLARPAEDADPGESSEEEPSPDAKYEYAFPHTPPAEAFFAWLVEENTDQDIVMEYRFGDEVIDLVHNGKLLMLVSFFDEPEREWLPDEEEFCGEPPLWFCDGRHRRSPLYTLKLASAYLRERGIGNVLPVTVMSDHIDIVGAGDIADVWRETGATVCYCFRRTDLIFPFAETLLEAEKNHPEYQEWDDEYLIKVRRALLDFEGSRV